MTICLRMLLVFCNYAIAIFAVDDFDMNSKWCAVKSQVYEAVVMKNGDLIVSLPDSPLRVKSFFRDGKTPLAFPYMKMQSYSQQKTDSKIALGITSLWNMGELRQEVIFERRDLTVNYLFKSFSYKPRSLPFVLAGIEYTGMGFNSIRMSTQGIDDICSCVDVGSDCLYHRFLGASFPVDQDRWLTTNTYDDTYLEILKFPNLSIRNASVWKKEFLFGEGLSIKYSIHILGNNDNGFEDAPIIFKIADE